MPLALQFKEVDKNRKNRENSIVFSGKGKIVFLDSDKEMKVERLIKVIDHLEEKYEEVIKIKCKEFGIGAGR